MDLDKYKPEDQDKSQWIKLQHRKVKLQKPSSKTSRKTIKTDGDDDKSKKLPEDEDIPNGWRVQVRDTFLTQTCLRSKSQNKSKSQTFKAGLHLKALEIKKCLSLNTQRTETSPPQTILTMKIKNLWGFDRSESKKPQDQNKTEPETPNNRDTPKLKTLPDETKSGGKKVNNP